MQTLEKKSIIIGNYTLQYSQVIGKGATGTVYRGYENTSECSVAIKVIELSTIKDDATRSLLQNEKSALKMVQNKNIIKLLDIIQMNQCCYIIMELYEGQTLKQYIAQRGMLSEEQSINIFRKILNGCLNITQNCIIHRDLKPANILINNQLQPKIIDFGFCEIITAKKVMRTFNVGSPSYMSPEAYLRTLYSQKSDSWSLGIILFEMLHGKTPDEKFAIKDYLQKIKNNPSFLSSLINSNLDKNVKEILQKSLKYLPEERMSISGMKYLADVYSIKLNKSVDTLKVSNFRNNNNYGVTSIKNLQGINEDVDNYFSTKHVTFSQKPQTQTLKNISNDSSSEDKNGFITFSDFSKNHSFSNRNKKSSQITLIHTDNKQSSIQYLTTLRPNENNHLMANKFIPNPIPVKIENYPVFNGYHSMNGFQNLSSKEILDRKMGPPAFRQITVRYL